MKKEKYCTLITFTSIKYVISIPQRHFCCTKTKFMSSIPPKKIISPLNTRKQRAKFSANKTKQYISLPKRLN